MIFVALSESKFKKSTFFARNPMAEPVIIDESKLQDGDWTEKIKIRNKGLCNRVKVWG